MDVEGGKDNMTEIQLNDMNGSGGEGEGGGGDVKRKKKVIYFSDGSTMEDFDDDDDEDDKQDGSAGGGAFGGAGGGIIEEKIIKSVEAGELGSAPLPAAVDTSKMGWPKWLLHQTKRAGSKTLTTLEGFGGSTAYMLGITSPKYQFEIDEYNRTMAKKKSQEEELVSWSTGPKGQSQKVSADGNGAVIVDDIKKTSSGGGDEGEVTKNGDIPVPDNDLKQ